MSAELPDNNQPLQGPGRLIITGPPGFEIQVLSSDYRLLLRGAERLEAELPTAVYVTRWVGPSSMKERIDLLLPIPTPLQIDYPADAGSPASAPSAALESLSIPAEAISERDSAIVVLEDCGVTGVKGELSKGLRLFNGAEIAMRSDRSEVEATRAETSPEAGGDAAAWALRVYPVPGGLYRLRYETATGETLDQTVPAIAGRRTVVLLRQTLGQSLVNNGTTFNTVFRRGAEPSRTVMISTPLTVAGPPDTDHLVQAEALLIGLALQGDPLSAATLKRIEAPDADPFMKLYGAWLIAAALARRVSPALDESYPTGVIAEVAFAARWQTVGKTLLAGLPEEMRVSADAVACAYALMAPPAPGPSAMPPMLATTVQHHAAIGLGSAAGFKPSVEGTETRGPWIVQRASASKSGRIVVSPAAAFLPNLGARRQGPYWRVLWEQVKSSAFWQSGLAIYAVAIAIGLAQEAGLFGQKPVTGVKTATMDLLSLPVLIAVGAILAAVAAYMGAVVVWHERKARKNVPALARSIVTPDDPHKGRFGKEASVHGFTLSAAFTERESNWVEVRLTITADKSAKVHNGDLAEFFLHPTFPENRVTTRFRNREATLVLKAWGGFTVGVWLPSQKTQLELDLALAPDAPPIVRDW